MHRILNNHYSRGWFNIIPIEIILFSECWVANHYKRTNWNNQPGTAVRECRLVMPVNSMISIKFSDNHSVPKGGRLWKGWNACSVIADQSELKWKLLNHTQIIAGMRWSKPSLGTLISPCENYWLFFLIIFARRR